MLNDLGRVLDVPVAMTTRPEALVEDAPLELENMLPGQRSTTLLPSFAAL